MSKRFKKIIVNSLTFSRILGTFLMPIIYNYLDPHTFLIVIGLLLLTDFFDGVLAKRWKVCTIFGSLLDMLADKMFAFAILIILGIIYPFMFIPLFFEVLITVMNIRAAFIGIFTKSSELGRIKMWILGMAIFVLLLTGLCIELKTILIKFDIFELIINNTEQIKCIFISGAIVAEFIVTCDYFIRFIKIGNSNKKISNFKFSDVKNNMQYIKRILFDEEYYIKTYNLPFSEKLFLNKIK